MTSCETVKIDLLARSEASFREEVGRSGGARTPSRKLRYKTAGWQAVQYISVKPFGDYVLFLGKWSVPNGSGFWPGTGIGGNTRETDSISVFRRSIVVPVQLSGTLPTDHTTVHGDGSTTLLLLTLFFCHSFF